MPGSYFNGFDALTRDENGRRVPLAGETFNVDEVGGGSLGTVTSDAFGWVNSDTVAVGPATTIAFTHDDYPGTEFRRVTAGSIADAETTEGNAVASFVLEDLTDEVEPESFDVYIEDTTNGTKPFFAGVQKYGETAGFPYVATETRGLKVRLNPRYPNGSKKHLSFIYGKSAEITAPAATGFAGGTGTILYLGSNWVINNDASLGSIPIGVEVLPGKYKVEVELWCGACTRSIKAAIQLFDQIPGPTVGQWQSFANTGGVSASAIVTDVGSSGALSDAALDGATNPYLFRFSGVIECPDGGTISPVAGQRTAHASNTPILKGSTVMVTKLADA